MHLKKRSIIGYDLYRKEHRLFDNLFLPSVKLSKKLRIGSKVKRVHDYAKTPLDRLIETNKGDISKLTELLKLRKILNPFELSKVIDAKLEKIWRMASMTVIKSATKPYKTVKPTLNLNYTIIAK